MDIEEFYDGDPRRRESEELEFGRDWSDPSGMRVEVSWVVDTGELYLMQEPNEPVFMDPVGDTVVPELPVEAIGVELLTVVPTREAIDALLAGWQQEMPKKSSIDWVRARVASAS
jgi:hypothetical protein